MSLDRFATHADVAAAALAAASPAGASVLPAMVSYAASPAAPIMVPNDGSWRTVSSDLVVTAPAATSKRMLVSLEAFLTMAATGRLVWGVSPGRIVTGLGYTSGSPTITAASGTFSADDVGLAVGAIGRTVGSIATTNTSTTITGPASTFTSADTGRKITGPGIPSNTTLTYVSGTEATLSNAATASATVTAYIDAGVPLTATISAVVSSSQATLSANATATGTCVTSVHVNAQYDAQDVVNQQVTSMLAHADLYVNDGQFVPGRLTTWIWRARCFSGQPIFANDGPNARRSKMVVHQLA